MLRNLLIITLLLGVVYTSAGQFWKKKEKAKVSVTDTVKVDYRSIGAPMPPIRMVMQNKKVVTAKTVANNANLFIMMFNPTCDHCISETVEIEKRIALFKKSHFLFLAAPTMGELLTYFENTTKISQYPSLWVGLDSSGFIDKTFRYESLPQINIYDKDRKLIRVFNGDTPIDSLKGYIE
jgi:hypothetical protein